MRGNFERFMTDEVLQEADIAATNLLWICLTCPRREYGVGSVGYIHRRLGSLPPRSGTCASGRGARTTSGARHPGDASATGRTGQGSRTGNHQLNEMRKSKTAHPRRRSKQRPFFHLGVYPVGRIIYLDDLMPEPWRTGWETGSRARRW